VAAYLLVSPSFKFVVSRNSLQSLAHQIVLSLFLFKSDFKRKFVTFIKNNEGSTIVTAFVYFFCKHSSRFEWENGDSYISFPFPEGDFPLDLLVNDITDSDIVEEYFKFGVGSK
jgi:hypothetical protein